MPPAPSATTSAPAVVNLFAYNGLVIGTWAASLAALRERLGLDASGIAIMLVGAGVAAITGMQVGGRLADRLGARRVVLTCVPLLMVGLVVGGFAANYVVLFVGALLLGLGNGGIDVAMNAIGVQVEAARPKPIMSFFHGMWSVGNFAGAALVYIAALSVPSFAVQAAVLVATVVGVAACVLAVRITPETAVVTHADETGAKTPIPRWAYLLGLMAIAFGLGEGTAMDWSGLHVTEVAGIPAAQGSLAVAVVAGFMVAIRLLGDALVARFGRRAVVRFGGACSALGYLITAIATPLPVLLIGWAMVGFGIGMIAPQVYAVAGHAAGGRGLAVVVTFGYATFLCGPAVIGFLAAHFGLQHTMFVPAVLLACLPFLASVMPADERPAPIS
ncbi:MAG: MFS transporter [Propionibacteriaceae bacterium]|jgi:MFS family permease|nr:MFS transporter [Propionibacteriaceae bacterium]